MLVQVLYEVDTTQYYTCMKGIYWGVGGMPVKERKRQETKVFRQRCRSDSSETR